MSTVSAASTAMQSLVNCFSCIEDPRVERTRIHELTDILVLAVLAVMVGAEGWEDIRECGIAKERFLRRYLRLPSGIPSEDTISRVMRMLRPNVVQGAFMAWVEELQGQLPEISDFPRLIADPTESISGHPFLRSYKVANARAIRPHENHPPKEMRPTTPGTLAVLLDGRTWPRANTGADPAKAGCMPGVISYCRECGS